MSLRTLPVQCTAGAVVVRNEKGQPSMQNVKVYRYVTGKRPDYAPPSSSEDEREDEEFIIPTRLQKQREETAAFDDVPQRDFSEAEKCDRRLRRLQFISEKQRKRKIQQPDSDGEDKETEERPGRKRESDSESDDEHMDDEQIEKRREIMRQRALEKSECEEILEKEEEKGNKSSSDSEYEEYTDSEEEETPRLKPIFIRKQDRLIDKEKETTEEIERKDDEKSIYKLEERRKETLKLLEEEIRRERGGMTEEEEDTNTNVPKLSDVLTDDENEECEFESWKLRELKRIKRDREEREKIEREKIEIERMHSLTDEERRLEMKMKPRVIINQAIKGKQKFLQKYYHRGAFYLDKEDPVFKRDISVPTLEDCFDKTVLPRVMQVKNFGRSGRTKYTHLVAQDTTSSFESPWISEAPQSFKFNPIQAGLRQVFEKPTSKKRKQSNV